MEPSLVLLLVVVGGYVAAHVVSRWLARRFDIVSGAEYLLLGVLLGPHVSGLIRVSATNGFAPFLTLALGWIGVVVGAQFHLPDLMRITSVQYRIAFAEALLTLATVSAAMAAVLHWTTGAPVAELLAPAAALGAVATASSPTGIALVARRIPRMGPVVRQLQLNAAVDALVAITAFGVLLSIDHPPLTQAVRPLTATEWVAVSLGIGCVGGLLFHLFLGQETQVDRLFIGLAGAIILASGAAAYLRLSPLLPAMLIGMILVNTSTARVEFQRVLSLVERPLYFVLLIFAGAAWSPSDRFWMIPVGAFLLARYLGKLGSAALAAWWNGALRSLGPGWGRALVGQGGLAVAIALNYQVYEHSRLANMVFTAALLSVLLTDLTAARVAETVLQSARQRIWPAADGGGRPGSGVEGN